VSKVYMIEAGSTEEFIRKHRNDDVRLLALQAARHFGIDMPYALDQIAGWQAARSKLPSWAAIDGIVYPPHISMEQCSSEQTARYKAEVVSEESLGNEECRMKNEESPDGGSKESLSQEDGKNSSFFILHSSFPKNSSFKTMIDLTGGFGVDFSFMAKGFDKAVYVERQEHLCDAARRNFALLGLGNAEVVCGDGVEYLHTIDHASMIYLDPARRDNNGARTYAIGDCTPDVLVLLPELLAKADRVMVKLSPMLDWHDTVKSLNAVCTDCVAEVHIVSVRNECKEMLVVMSKDNKQPLTLYCVDLNEESLGNEECRMKNEEFFPSSCDEDSSFPTSNDSSFFILHSSFPKKSTFKEFLYEPNASIMKAGCFAQLCGRYGVKAVGRNSHLFVSEEKIECFPGRSFRIKAVSSMNKKELKKTLAGITKANITVRNFPLPVAELRKRLKLKDGGDTYIFATTTADNKHILIVTEKEC